MGAARAAQPDDGGFKAAGEVFPIDRHSARLGVLLALAEGQGLRGDDLVLGEQRPRHIVIEREEL